MVSASKAWNFFYALVLSALASATMAALAVHLWMPRESCEEITLTQTLVFAGLWAWFTGINLVGIFDTFSGIEDE